MTLRVAIPDLISPSYFPVIAAVELGFFEHEGLPATIELIFPVTKTCESLRERRVDYVGGAAHAPLYAFEDWRGCKLLCALSQNMYWFLIIRADIPADRGDLSVLKGLRIGAAPGPVDGLRRMLMEAGMDPDEEVTIAPVSGAEDGSVSFGVTAAKALEDNKMDGFWANGMGAEIAIRSRVGKLLIDARRGDGPTGAEDYTFPALITTERRINHEPEQVAGAIRAIVAAQQALKRDPTLATEAARSVGFPNYEASLIADLIERDGPFYEPLISEAKVSALNRFARDLEILSEDDIPYESVVATQFLSEWMQ